MYQKFCATCHKTLTPAERSADQIQCAQCYRNWLASVVTPMEPQIRERLRQMREHQAET